MQALRQFFFGGDLIKGHIVVLLEHYFTGQLLFLFFEEPIFEHAQRAYLSIGPAGQGGFYHFAFPHMECVMIINSSIRNRKIINCTHEPCCFDAINYGTSDA